jgi:signal transduction histidine kinase
MESMEQARVRKPISVIQLIKSRLQAKLILLQVIVVVIPVLIIAVYAAAALNQALTQQLTSRELDKLDAKTQTVESLLESAEQDARFVSHNSVIQRYVDSLNGEPDAALVADVEALFVSFLSSADTPYKDVRILDRNGMEIVRVDQSNGVPVVISGSELEDKSQRPYYTEAIGLDDGQMYVSGFDLNVTRGQVDLPYLPVIRFSTPLYDGGGEVVGVLILKAFAEPILTSLLSDDAQDYIIGPDGTYLYHPDSSRLYGGLLQNGTTFATDQPQLEALIEGRDAGTLNDGDTITFFKTVNPNQLPNLHLLVIRQNPASVVLASVYQAVFVFVAITAVTILITVVVASLLSRSIARPVRQLAAAAKELGRGHWNAALPPVTGEDEIAQLTTSFGTMSGELQETYRSLQARTREAEEATRMKDLFMATMSHELRTPLNAMIGFLHLMMYSDQMNDDNSHMAQRSLANSQRLLTLINNILDLSRIATGGIEIVAASVSPRRLARALYADMKVLIEEKNLALELEIDPELPESIHHDEDRISQIVVNLVNNAIKFTQEGKIQLAFLRREERLLIQVTDTGIGIPQSKQALIFDDFFQVDSSSSRQHQGAGLGLAIVKRLVLLMGGSISLVSEPGKGSTFSIELPLNLASKDGSAATRANGVFSKNSQSAPLDAEQQATV